ncbi:ferredoxin [Mycobacterium sp. GA-2829]|uniref:ferredoxin n=1 Tax=Mycobacterium sp. GA-2829 TaxID=1772283 RepID=UPI00073FCAC0|nr:ferredoxin [Mycobacterium sp. GA-2829]KUI39273.1 ferredoxin [Mycobacterium sp. GA-2829]
MHITVDLAKCQDHGQCTIAAPAVFTLNDEGNLEYNGSPDDSERAYVEDAADVCPVQAIFIED